MNKWYMNAGPRDDIVVSSRVRLARNLKKYPFPGRMSLEQAKEVALQVKEAVEKGGFSGGLTMRFVDMASLSEMEAWSLVERHCISPDFAKNRQGRYCIISADESVSIMLGEEDHIRLQVILPGFALGEAYQTADRLDRLICESLEIAFDENLGYLTACPTNLGTGLRASVMLHLPALSGAGAISRLTSSVSKVGLTVRGMYGEGTDAKANFYQLSNQVTLGISEQSAIENLTSIATQLITQEKAARGQADRLRLEDKAWRAFGLLQTARLLSGEELFALLSALRLGVSMGILTDIAPATLTTLMFQGGANTLQLTGEKSPAERDEARAKMARMALGGSA